MHYDSLVGATTGRPRAVNDRPYIEKCVWLYLFRLMTLPEFGRGSLSI